MTPEEHAKAIEDAADEYADEYRVESCRSVIVMARDRLKAAIRAAMLAAAPKP